MKRGRIIAISGLVASGKSTVAEKLSEILRAQVISSDVIRKRMAGIDPFSHIKCGYKKAIYSPSFTHRVYESIIKTAVKEAKEGKDVIVDATFSQKRYRDMLRCEAEKEKIPLFFFFLDTPEATIIERLRKREKERTVSDADISVYLKMKETYEYPQEDEDVVVLKGDKRAEEIVEEILKTIKEGQNGF